MKTTNRITAINFTYAISMFWIDLADGTRRCVTAKQLTEMVGEAEYARLWRIASQMTGHWHRVS